MLWDQSLIGLFHKGGFAMWPLLVCSVFSVAIILERTLFFARIRFDYDAFLSKLKQALAAKRFKEAAAACESEASPVPRIAGLYLANLKNDAIRYDIIKREGSLAMEKVEAKLRGLAAMTHIAPLLGLLGTVTGLVSAFHRIEVLGGQVQPSDLASGIWEALITTVFGLVIAIPSMAAYHGFESMADRIARRMQFVVSELDEFFGKKTDVAGLKGQDAEGVEEGMKAVG